MPVQTARFTALDQALDVRKVKNPGISGNDRFTALQQTYCQAKPVMSWPQ